MALKYHVKTFGCQMNHSDSERVAAVLENVGYLSTEKIEDADFVVFNTCSIKQKAEDKVYGLMSNMVSLKKKNNRLVVSITGCMVRKTSTRLSDVRDRLTRLEPVDFVFRIDDSAQIPDLIKQIKPELDFGSVKESEEGSLDSYFKINPKYTNRFQGLVPIMSGCDKFCAFCIVPYTRGRERSRSIEEVYSECKKLVENGCKEVTLLGQNVNSFGLNARENPDGFIQHIQGSTMYGKSDAVGLKKTPFTQLLERLDTLKKLGLKRVRWTSPHPRDMTDDV
ncbi:MAG: radical SAM protein, partial [Patescibacteria group bacterium]